MKWSEWRLNASNSFIFCFCFCFYININIKHFTQIHCGFHFIFVACCDVYTFSFPQLCNCAKEKLLHLLLFLLFHFSLSYFFFFFFILLLQFFFFFLYTCACSTLNNIALNESSRSLNVLYMTNECILCSFIFILVFVVSVVLDALSEIGMEGKGKRWPNERERVSERERQRKKNPKHLNVIVLNARNIRCHVGIFSTHTHTHIIIHGHIYTHTHGTHTFK